MVIILGIVTFDEKVVWIVWIVTILVMVTIISDGDHLKEGMVTIIGMVTILMM